MEDGMQGKEIANLIYTMAKEGKTPEEVVEFLMKVLGYEPPEFKKQGE